jgi:hypothetical protein
VRRRTDEDVELRSARPGPPGHHAGPRRVISAEPLDYEVQDEDDETVTIGSPAARDRTQQDGLLAQVRRESHSSPIEFQNPS